MEFSQGVPAKTGKFSERPINKDDIIYCIRLFKCFFCQVEEKNNEKIDSLKSMLTKFIQIQFYIDNYYKLNSIFVTFFFFFFFYLLSFFFISFEKITRK